MNSIYILVFTISCWFCNTIFFSCWHCWLQRILSVQYSIPDYVHISSECRQLLSQIFVSNPAKARYFHLFMSVLLVSTYYFLEVWKCTEIDCTIGVFFFQIENNYCGDKEAPLVSEETEFQEIYSVELQPCRVNLEGTSILITIAKHVRSKSESKISNFEIFQRAMYAWRPRNQERT